MKNDGRTILLTLVILLGCADAPKHNSNQANPSIGRMTIDSLRTMADRRFAAMSHDDSLQRIETQHLPGAAYKDSRFGENAATIQKKSYPYNSDEVLHAAEDFEAAVFVSVPKAKKFISFFDIDTKDGHLMVVTKDALLRVDEKTQNEVYKTLLDMWRRTKYVRTKKYADWLEVLSIEGTRIRTIK